MAFYDIYSAIPYALTVIGDIFHMETTLFAKRKSQQEQRSAIALFCSFPWERQIDPALFVEPVDAVYLRDVVDMPEFRERLSNLLSKSGKYKCTVHPVEQDTKILYDGDIERDEAMLFVEYAPWSESDFLYASNCIMNGDATDERHWHNHRRVCPYCGSYSGCVASEENEIVAGLAPVEESAARGQTDGRL